MISFYTGFFTAVSFRNMTDHLVYISDISPQTIRQSTSVLPQTALMSPVCFHCVIHSHVSQASLPPQSDSGSVCGMCFGFVPKAYTEHRNKGPLCALFFTFLSPDISPVPGRTLKWLCAGRGPLDLCSLASVPWFGGGPYHPSQSPHNNAIKGMLYIPHVVLQQKLDG